MQRFFLSRPEIQLILANAQEPHRTWYGPAAETGLRAGELCGLTVDDIDLERGMLQVRQSSWRGKLGDPKTTESIRVVELSPQSSEAPEDLLGIVASERTSVALRHTNCPDALYWLAGVEIKRHGGTCNFIRTMLRWLPRNGGSVRLLIFPYCSIPRRGLYGWELGGHFTSTVTRSAWGCRKCNLLRYALEGGALLIRPRGTLGLVFGIGHSLRPESWLPYVFTSTEEAAEAGVL